MSGIKNLASQTMWYGGSSILARLLNYLLTPYLTLKLSGQGYGEVSMIYAAIPFINVLFTYGLETAFFRFSKSGNERNVYNTTMVSIISSTFGFSVLLLLFYKQIAFALRLDINPEFVLFFIAIIALDTLTALPFALLRQQGRPIKFASVRITNIVLTMALTWFFISYLPQIAAEKPKGLIRPLFIENYQVGYVLLANLIASAVQFLHLSKEFFSFNWKVDKTLWKEIMTYTLPLIIVGLGGMVNETADRLMLGWLSPAATEAAQKTEVAIYAGCYKLSILITLFIQAFRMGAEPFFFKTAEAGNPQKTYARVMKFFVMTICTMFLVIVMYLEVWKHFLRQHFYWEGLAVVPILVLANMFLGVYYNLSIWYKVTNNTLKGAWITLVGAAITLIINFVFIPRYSYMACAWGTFAAYASMMVISYVWGQKEYPVPYNMRKILSYFIISLIAFCIFKGITGYFPAFWVQMMVATALLGLYVWFLTTVEHEEFSKLPVVGKYFKQHVKAQHA